MVGLGQAEAGQGQGGEAEPPGEGAPRQDGDCRQAPPARLPGGWLTLKARVESPQRIAIVHVHL